MSVSARGTIGAIVEAATDNNIDNKFQVELLRSARSLAGVRSSSAARMAAQRSHNLAGSAVVQSSVAMSFAAPLSLDGFQAAVLMLVLDAVVVIATIRGQPA
jgi:hypothetical protein